jgi:hypothetical protein
MTSHVHVKRKLAVAALHGGKLLGRARRGQRNRFNDRQVKLLGGVVDIEANNVALRVEVDDETLHDLPGFNARDILQFDVEAVGFRIEASLPKVTRRRRGRARRLP